MRNPEDIRLELSKLIEEAESDFPNLAARLDEIKRWIAKKKSALLMRKKHVMRLLTELVDDTTFWLTVQSLSEEDRSAEFSQLSPAEQYWYKYLFPAWFNEQDPKLPIWKKKLMADAFEASDTLVIDNICRQIEFYGGTTLNPYIADLSMATDLIASGTGSLVLCVQLTSVRGNHAIQKKRQWLLTLKRWGIQRGLFISFNPMKEQVESKIGKGIFKFSDQLPETCYRECNIK